MKTITVCVTPRIGVEIKTNKPADYRPYDNTDKVLIKAIKEVRNMDPDKLKKLVIDGLYDADMYPRDFAEF